ncbi:HipA family kinase [Weissella viridescens]|uniref:HipA-like kinase domain-containing protein n=1 Tax=Weissella viridescens TaxID=1629 RepID=A0A0R2GZZ2_WEIVI|nr:HipA family kinase [Weissella viridescens]KRN46226.1 hypothetical protein IV50_GL001211 [Weissella viridescens]
MYVVNDIIKAQPGTTKPYLVTATQSDVSTDIPELFVIKFMQNAVNEEVSGKILFNEYLGTKLGKDLGLPVMQGEFFNLPQSVINTSNELIRLGAEPGICYGTKYVDGQTAIISPKTLEKINNKKDFGSLLFYDQFLLNIDRGYNRGNWFFDVNFQLRAFDFTQILGGIEQWNCFTLQHLKDNPPKLVESMDDIEYQYLADKIDSSRTCFLDIQRKLTNIDFNHYVQSIPPTWDITSDDKQAVVDFLEFQKLHSDDIINSLKNKFNLM